MDYRTKRKYRKAGRRVLIMAALMGKIAIGFALMFAGTFITFHAFTHTSIDDLRIGVLALKFLGIAFLILSVSIPLTAVREVVEDARYM